MALQVITDSTCDLSKDVLGENKIEVIPLLVSYGDDKYYQDFYEVTAEEFYNKLIAEKCQPKTTMPTLGSFLSVFDKHASEGRDIIYISMTSKFSGAYDTALLAATQIKEKYEKLKIEVIDSKITSVMQGFMALDVVRLAKEGRNFTEIVDAVNRIKLNCGVIFTLETLSYALKGGRLGKAAGMAADLLNIKAVMSLDGGEVCPCAKVRTRKKALDKMVELVVERTSEFNKAAVTYFLLHAGAYEEAFETGKKLAEKIGRPLKYKPTPICTVVGAHAGPGTIGIGWHVSE